MNLKYYELSNIFIIRRENILMTNIIKSLQESRIQYESASGI